MIRESTASQGEFYAKCRDDLELAEARLAAVTHNPHSTAYDLQAAVFKAEIARDFARAWAEPWRIMKAWADAAERGEVPLTLARGTFVNMDPGPLPIQEQGG